MSGSEHEAAREQMLATNRRQQVFYESRYEAKAGARARERAANAATNAWSRLRRAIQSLRAVAGVDDHLERLHREWLGDLQGKRVLDLGCFDGNRLSMYLAESAGEYHGIDLSQQATEVLDARFRERGLTTARAYVQDLLANEWPDGYFDVVYAYSVLHHFRDLDVALRELRRILRPGGIIIAMDPMQTEPFNRLARAIYRPLQTDRDWEFPFDRSTFRLFRRHFRIGRLQGIQGLVKLSYPFLLAERLRPLGRAIARRTLGFDNRYARDFGLPFYLCWHATMQLVADEPSADDQGAASP